jgi:hypothetical protein
MLLSQGVRVSGVTFDSLSGRPLPVAFVMLGSKSTMADSIGRFQFDSVAPGSYRLTMQHDLLDSLGVSGVSMTVVVSEGMPPIRVATPSIMTMWKRVCPGVAPPDSGFIFGTVLDATSRTPVRNAPIVATWIEIRRDNLATREYRLESSTIDDGSFVLCGVPLGTGVRLHSSHDSVVATSLDLLLSQSAPIRRQDLSLADSRAARGVVRGAVISAGKGVPNARVIVGSSSEARTGANGQFIIRDVTPGTQQIEVQGIGFAPTTRILNVLSGDTVQVSFDVEKIVTLDSVTVRGSIARQRLANQFEERRRHGMGYYRDSTQLGKYQSFEGVFGTMPSVTIQHPRGRTAISIGSRCANAAIYIDRMRSDSDHLSSLRPSDLAALEIYRPGDLPLDLSTVLGIHPMAKPCAIVAWTKMGWR